MKKVAILIPAYEPDDKLVRLVETLRPLGAHLVVVDDGSVRPEARAAFAAVLVDVCHLVTPYVEAHAQIA